MVFWFLVAINVLNFLYFREELNFTSINDANLWHLWYIDSEVSMYNKWTNTEFLLTSYTKN